jgi:uncharacterized protein (TIGR03435 family)
MRGGPGTNSPGQIVYSSTTLRAVMATAYGVQRTQIAGPPWFDQERFDITAKIPPSTFNSCRKRCWRIVSNWNYTWRRGQR